MMKPSIAGLGIILTLVACPLVSAEEPRFDDASAFERLQDLDGEWTGTYGDQDLTVRFDTTAGGTTVVLTEYPGTDGEEVMLFWMDGASLVAKHFCSLGNQPTYRFEPNKKAGVMTFAFDGGTNLDPEKDTHAHSTVFRFSGRDQLEAIYSFWEGGKETSVGKATLGRTP